MARRSIPRWSASSPSQLNLHTGGYILDEARVGYQMPKGETQGQEEIGTGR